MKRLLGFLLTGIALCAANFTVCAETETIDLKALAKKARPAVMLLVVSDATGKEIATGTGFLVSSDGKLITNFHVIEKAASAVAKAENGGLFPVEGVLASDPKNDLVLLKLKGKELPFLTLGKSENIEVGTRIAVIGSPLGLEGTLSEGIVSAVRELMGDLKLLQVTAAISPGSSGSPVMNAKGDVIGIASALLRGGQALNLAAPVECANRLMDKAKPSNRPQPLLQSAGSDEDVFYSDPDWRAACAAEAVDDHVMLLKCVKSLVARYPENATARFGLGYMFGRLQFTDDAIAAYRQAVKIKPDFADAWYNLGVVYKRSGRTDDAILAYRQAIKVQPDHVGAWSNLGAAYGESGRSGDAVAACRQAIKIKPDFADPWYNMGVAFGDLARTDDAILAYLQTIKIKKNHSEAWYNLGVCYDQVARTNEAIDAYRHATKINPNHTNAWFNLGIRLSGDGRIDDAIPVYRQVIKLNPEDADAWRNLGVCLSESGLNADAITAYRQVIRIRPEDAETWYNLGNRLGQAGRLDDAIAALRQAVKIKTGFAEAWYNLGMAYRQSARTQDAAAALQRAKELKPELFK
jgi:tetratricopeptide (TPR) repeat protein